jgi:ABC-type multidrug transport system fused ATPase/permease subunit
LILLGAIVFFLLIISLSIKALTTYLQVRFTLMREHSIGKKLIENYLHQPYSWFLNRNSSELGKNIISEVSITVNQFFMPMMNLITNFFIIILLLLMLIFVEPVLTITIIIFFGVLYGIIFLMIKTYLNKIGKKRLAANQSRFMVINESFGSPKEMKLKRLEEKYSELFGEYSKYFANYQSYSQIIARLPRFGIEAVAFGGMLLVMLYLISEKGSFSSALPIITLYVFAAYRLMPAMQQLYTAVTQLQYSKSSFNQVYNDFKNTKTFKFKKNNNLSPVTFKNRILIKDISYTYPKSSNQTLKNINISIKAKTKVAIIGSTGSGKTTTIDIILGLLEATKGTFKVDDLTINYLNCHQWQKKIGYVPQQIYLTDDTIASNIAFGLETSKIDKQRIEEAAKLASLHSFITNELPKKYETVVGERGVRLSGGQRQRIGIARALYQNPEVLVFDEATNSLDNITEEKIMNSIYNLQQDKTILIIAHRLSTIKKCDQIILIEKGEIIAQDTYDNLLKSNQIFIDMVTKERKE